MPLQEFVVQFKTRKNLRLTLKNEKYADRFGLICEAAGSPVTMELCFGKSPSSLKSGKMPSLGNRRHSMTSDAWRRRLAASILYP